MRLMLYSGDAEFLAYPVAANVSGAGKRFLRDFVQVFIVGALIAAIFLWRSIPCSRAFPRIWVGIRTFVSAQIIGPSIRRSASLQSAPVPLVYQAAWGPPWQSDAVLCCEAPFVRLIS